MPFAVLTSAMTERRPLGAPRWELPGRNGSQYLNSPLLHDSRGRLARACRDSLFALYRWELVQKFVERVAAFQVVGQGSKRHPRTDENRRSAEDVGIAVNDLVELCHPILAWRLPSSGEKEAIELPGHPILPFF
jgi:hypothetical protein